MYVWRSFIEDQFLSGHAFRGCRMNSRNKWSRHWRKGFPSMSEIYGLQKGVSDFEVTRNSAD